MPRQFEKFSQALRQKYFFFSLTKEGAFITNNTVFQN